jgi:HD-GYP domain-containing protein (c-di-GMP phosphodiesterase class II)
MADAYTAAVVQVRVVEILAAVSLTTDLASGMPFEKGLQTCAVATSFARSLGLAEPDLDIVFHAALMRSIGCTAYASENAEFFGDDVRFQRALKELDVADPAQLRRFGDWAPPGEQPVLAARFQAVAPVEGPRAVRAGCAVAHALAPRLGLPTGVAAALDDVYERWDGHGFPGRVGGDDVSLAIRIVHVGEQAVLAYHTGGAPAAIDEVSRRAGGHLDPDLVDAFRRAADAHLDQLRADDALAAVLRAEPRALAPVGPDGLLTLSRALAVVVDLKGRFLLGHSAHVAGLASTAGRLAGLDGTDLEIAGLLHDIGRVGVPSAVWDRPGPHSSADWERIRLHPYWTERVLRRCPALAPLADLAAAHHEHLDGSGYHRGARAADLSPAQRLLAAADAFAELTEPRPDRPALDLAAAARLMDVESRAGRLDADACAAVVEAAGLPRRAAAYPADLSAREVDVLRLAARGLSNKQIAAELSLSDRTVGNHLARVYDKIGNRTRAGAAVFAIEHGLLPARD